MLLVALRLVLVVLYRNTLLYFSPGVRPFWILTNSFRFPSASKRTPIPVLQEQQVTEDDEDSKVDEGSNGGQDQVSKGTYYLVLEHRAAQHMYGVLMDGRVLLLCECCLHFSPGVCPNWILTNLFPFCLETQINLYPPRAPSRRSRRRLPKCVVTNHIGMICLGCRSFEGLA